MNWLADFSLLQEKWSVDLIKVSAFVVNLGLLVFLVYGVAQLVSQWRADGAAEPMVQRVPEGGKSGDEAGLKSSFAIAQWHLFGKAESVTLQQEKITNAPDTKLDMTLRGIYFPGKGEGAVAIIQDARKQEQPFVVGDSVFRLATLEQIHIDRVILLHKGRHETLRLPKESLGLKFVEDARVVASKTIQEFRKDLLTGNMQKYIYNVDYDTVYDENGFAGFKIIGDSEKGKEILQAIGLEDGDIVTKIDDVDLANDPNMINTLRNLRTAEIVNLSIKRAGTIQHVTLDFTQK